MIICEVEQGGKNYVFKAPCKIQKDIYVMCDTCKGERPGRVVCSFEVSEDSELFKSYLRAMGAYAPLKDVTGIFVPLKWLSPSAKESGVYAK